MSNPDRPDHAAPDVHPRVAAAAAVGFPGGVDTIPDVTYTSPSNAAKAIISTVTAMVLAILGYLGTLNGRELLPSDYAQLVAVGLLSLSVWVAKYNPTWWKSVKAYVLGGQALAAALAPAIANSIDGTGFHLTGQQWVAFLLTALGAVLAIVAPNSQGMDNRPLKAALVGGAYDVSSLPPTPEEGAVEPWPTRDEI